MKNAFCYIQDQIRLQRAFCIKINAIKPPLINLLTPLSRVLLEKLTGFAADQEIHEFGNSLSRTLQYNLDTEPNSFAIRYHAFPCTKFAERHLL
jgi:hypothetical protein